MKSSVLEEINRNRQLMGLSLITEQGVAWLDDLIRKGYQRFTGLDNIIKKLGLKGKDLTDADIDKIIDELPDELVDSELKLAVKQTLKNEENLKSALKNGNDNFLLELRKYKNASAFKNIVNLTADEVKAIVKRTVTKMLDDASSSLSIGFDNLDLAMTELVEASLKNSGSKLRNVDEIYDIAEARIQDILKGKIKNGMDFNVAEEVFNNYRTKLRTDSKLKTKLDEISSSGRNSNLQKRTKSITDFNSKVDLPEELLSKQNWIDDTVPPVRDGGDVPPVRDGGDVPPVRNGGDVPSTIDEVDNYLDEIDPPGPTRIDLFPGGVPDPTFFTNFWFKWCKMGFCEVLIDFIRSLGKTPADFADDMISTQARITDLVDRLGRMNPGDAGYTNLKFELDGWVNRLKSNTKMVSTPQTGFISQWENVKNNIRTTLGPEHRDLAEQVIQYCENRAVTSGNETIGEFILLLNQKSSGLDLPLLLDLRKVATPEYWANWSKTRVVKYANEVKDHYRAASQKFGGWFRGFITSVGKILKDFFEAVLKRTANFMTLKTFRYYKDLVKRLRMGSFTNAEGLKRYMLLYVELTIIANVVGPFIEYAEDLIKTALEVGDIMETDEEKKTPIENLYENLLERIPGFGNEFEWNPLFNPLGFVPGSREIGDYLGFEPAPLPEYIVRGIRFIFEKIGWLSNQNRAKDVNETRRRQLQSQFEDMTNNYINTINDQSVREYEANKSQVEARNGKEKVFKTIENYSNPIFTLYYPDFDLLTIDEVKRLRDALVFQPGISPETKNSILNRERNKKRSVKDKNGKLVGFYYPTESINKFIPNDLGEKDGLKPSPTAPKDTKVEYPDVDSMLSDLKNNNGYWALKGSDGKLYLLKPNESGFMYYLTPSIDEIEKDPNVKVKQNDLQKFVDKL